MSETTWWTKRYVRISLRMMQERIADKRRCDYFAQFKGEALQKAYMETDPFSFNAADVSEPDCLNQFVPDNYRLVSRERGQGIFGEQHVSFLFERIGGSE